MKPFTPKREDGRSLRTVVVDLFKNEDYGKTISYKQLAVELGLHPVADLSIIQHTALSANKQLLKLHKRGLQAVRNTGYRIIDPREHMVVANSHASKAERAMVRALQFFSGTDLTKLTDIERKLHHGQQMIAMALYASHQHLDKRIQKIEELLAGTSTINPD